jgi:hypothetical protein
MVVFRDQVSVVLGVSDVLPIVIAGIGVMLFGGHLLIGANRGTFNLLELRYFALMDVLWVVGSIAALVAFSLPSPGFWLIAGTALIISDFGILEIIGMRSLKEESAR